MLKTNLKDPFFKAFLFIIILLLGACQISTNNSSEKKISAPLFQLVPAAKSGIAFNNEIEENFKNFFAKFNYVYNGGGVAIGDINNDGLSDIYFTGNDIPNKLYLNKGNLQFEDITTTAKIDGGDGWHNGVVMVDINHDGWLDIYVCRGGWEDTGAQRKNLLFINQQDDTFEEEAEKYGIADKGYSLQASFFDMDNDGDLDMYLTNRPNRFFLGYEKVLAGKKAGNDLHRDKLYRNDGGQFTEIGNQAGITSNYGYGLGISTSDFNKDGFIDIYVANDYLESDYLYVNQGNGTFKEKIKDFTNHIPFYAMGIDAVDINNDGWEDLIELEMSPEDYERSKTTMASMNPQLFANLVDNGFHYQYMHNMLQLNQGNTNKSDIFFSEIAQLSGIAKTDWSWACLGSDFDNDGYRDIFISNGFRRDIWDKDANKEFQRFMRSPEARKQTNEQKAKYIINLFKPNKLVNYVYKNNGDLTFSNQTKNWGITQESFSNGMAVGDLDNDGDLDLVINNIEDKAFLYQNTAENNLNNYLKIKLKGNDENPAGLGAKIQLKYNDQVQYHEFKTVRGYLSSVEPIVHFGLGEIEEIATIEVLWQDGRTNILKDISVNQLLTIDQQSASQTIIKNGSLKTLFTDITKQAFRQPFRHLENDFDDYKTQILLPHKLSQNGPCLTVGDVNNDGLEDFYVGGAMGQPGKLFIQNENSQFNALTNSIFTKDAGYEDVAATFFDADNDGDLDLYVVSGGNEHPANSNYYQDRLYFNLSHGKFDKVITSLPILTASGACVVPYDYDDDGDFDLFVGGRHTPSQYPTPPNSYLLENKNGEFHNVTVKIAPELANIGMVTDAVWADIDGDKQAELLVVGEWMPITIFKNNKGILTRHPHLEPKNSSGWWNTITATDYDKDGDLDFAVGNLGLNYKFKASKEKPFKIFAKDFDKNGTQDVFLAKYYKDRVVPIRGKECSSQQLPILNNKYPTYQQFAKADINEILGQATSSALKYEVQNFASIFLENKNGKLVSEPFPIESQFSSINAILPIDANGDKKMDFLVGGNKLESEIETTRADALASNVILQATNVFNPTKPNENGIFLPKNIKKIKAIKLGKNQGIGLLIAINNEELRLFRKN